ncbi:MAG: transferase, partial [Intestinibacter bartlettii]|nr:transferase [Intestinibacter bartlettii]
MKDLIIIGVGGVGREATLIAEEINEQSQEWNILGFVDDNEDVQNKYINGYPVLGKSHYLQNYKEEVYVFCGISNYKVKKKIISKLKENQNIKFANLIHPSVKLNKHIKIGEGCI